MTLQLAREGAVVFGDHEGGFRHPERVSHLFRETQKRCARMLGDDAPPVIRLHDLRHTHATILQIGGVASDATFSGKRERPWPALLR